jgi:hypothetical protein
MPLEIMTFLNLLQILPNLLPTGNWELVPGSWLQKVAAGNCNLQALQICEHSRITLILRNIALAKLPCSIFGPF